jgi:hypothetical protein
MDQQPPPRPRLRLINVLLLLAAAALLVLPGSVSGAALDDSGPMMGGRQTTGDGGLRTAATLPDATADDIPAAADSSGTTETATGEAATERLLSAAGEWGVTGVTMAVDENGAAAGCVCGVGGLGWWVHGRVRHMLCWRKTITATLRKTNHHCDIAVGCYYESTQYLRHHV